MKTCTWIGHGEGCSHPTVADRSYCEHHVWLVYVQGSQLSKRKKDIRTATTIRFWEDLMNQAVEELEIEGWSFESPIDTNLE